MVFPEYRPRRMRRNEALRGLIRETTLSADQLIYPLFIVPGKKVKNKVRSMPGVHQISVDQLASEAKELLSIGVKSVMRFGIPEKKDGVGSGAHDKDGIVERAIRELKNKSSELLVITDVCLCEYTDHGHCGFLVNDEVDNDTTLEILAKTALSHARAGADIVAPSDMMDGRVGGHPRSTRSATDIESTPILSYAAKYASAFYGPFREAAESTPSAGDRRGYQMDPANAREALREVRLDVEEGADIVMVKPAMAYLDVIRKVKETFEMPVAASNVSGEFSMVVAAAERGWIDRERMVLEVLTSIKRAGADIILTYHAREPARLLR